VKYSFGQSTKKTRIFACSFQTKKMSTADATNSNNTSKTDEYIKLRVVGQDNSELLFI
jgi:hypothetical protein